MRGDTSVARLHRILQIAFGWQDMHLHRFEIRGREDGVHQEGGVFFDTDAHEVLIGQLKLRRLERFPTNTSSWMPACPTAGRATGQQQPIQGARAGRVAAHADAGRGEFRRFHVSVCGGPGGPGRNRPLGLRTTSKHHH
ncbi:hypothetical protein QTI17_34735 [Variovorax sp. J31P179]|uniref:IS1096 element passenger TnpR family protein n=1 Tax=Variovorax sp. J31P179 TaxID=3053508 RepID=UPI002575C9E9|nr:hypothetical protein [Variovorax sp. J31P179]MDM0085747.1 hypothetical protein [Variovorax sp. J31P179]